LSTVQGKRVTFCTSHRIDHL